MANDLVKFTTGIKEKVMSRVGEYVNKGQLVIPKDYSPETAIQAAMLNLRTVVDRNKEPVLKNCTPDSIANSLFDMVSNGLSVMKKQGYFIAYGKELSFQRSYFGTVTALKNVLEGDVRVPGQVVYEGDELEYEIDVDTNEKIIKKHIQKFGNINNDKIIGAYASIIQDGKKLHTELMTIDQIHQSWRQSKQHPFGDDGKLRPGTVHAKFPDQMALRTVIERAAKFDLNTSTDKKIMIEAFNRTSEQEYERDVTHDVPETEGKNRLAIEPEIEEERNDTSQERNDIPEPENGSQHFENSEFDEDQFYDDQAMMEEDPGAVLFG